MNMNKFAIALTAIKVVVAVAVLGLDVTGHLGTQGAVVTAALLVALGATNVAGFLAPVLQRPGAVELVDALFKAAGPYLEALNKSIQGATPADDGKPPATATGPAGATGGAP